MDALVAFDPLTATEAEIRQKVKSLRGLTLGQVAASSPSAKKPKNLGDAGFVVESFFGIKPNSLPMPDFPGAGIELKTVPLVKGTRGFRCKEKTFITVIDYGSMVGQTWAKAHVRAKLNTLLIFIQTIPGEDWQTYRVIGYHFQNFLEDPRSSFYRLARADWLKIQGRVRDGHAHLLSARDGLVLAPATKGRNALSKRPQPFGPDATKRSFALRPSMMKAVYRDSVGSHSTAQESLLAALAPSGTPDLEKLIRARLRPHLGKTLRQVARKVGYRASGSSRSYGAEVVQLALGAKSPRSRIVEFDEAGITLRRPRVNPSGIPYEEVSFPPFWVKDLKEEETWEESALKPLIENMLFVPLIGERRDTPLKDCKVGTPAFWRPDDDEIRTIGLEWASLKEQLLQGNLVGLRREHIHMRPHVRNATVTDSAAGEIFTRKSYWLNKGVVAAHL